MDFHLFIVSIVEGITEFLPVSSTAHLIIASKLLSIDLTSPIIKFFMLAIQFGALIAGAILFTKKILLDKKLLKNITISFIPSAILGFILYKTFKHLLEGNFILISLMLFIGGVLFIWFEKYFMKQKFSQKDELTNLDAFVVGIAQAVAIIPGVSRSGATIIAGILRGVKKETIIEYTFLLALPTVFSAVAYDTYKSKDLILNTQFTTVLLGSFVAFITSFITLVIIRKYLSKISLTYFGIYRILLSLFVLYLFVL